jgi:tetratricopeptide (TPR) repeat protein
LILRKCLVVKKIDEPGATPKTFLEGCIFLAQGDNTNAQKCFQLAQPAFETAVKEAPENADRHANLGWLYAFAGRKAEALREGRRAVELKPESRDAFHGAIMNCYFALIYALVGENDLAIPLIERLLKTPGTVDSVDYTITINDLKISLGMGSASKRSAFSEIERRQRALTTARENRSCPESD